MTSLIYLSCTSGYGVAQMNMCLSETDNLGPEFNLVNIFKYENYPNNEKTTVAQKYQNLTCYFCPSLSVYYLLQLLDDSIKHL